MIGTSVESHLEKIDEYEDTPIATMTTIHKAAGPELSALDDLELDKEYTRRRILRRILPMIDPLCESEFSWLWKFPKAPKYYQTNINELFQLVPHRGLLKPNEIQNVQVIFQPKTNINVKAILECEVLGGPAETITVTGQSSNLLYSLNTQKLNFKIRSFHENASEQLIVSNITQLPFECKTYLNEPNFENELEGTILDLRPPQKILEPEEIAKLQIIMRPGVVGYFHREFLLEIGHLPHVPIEVYGWGVIPQVYLTLPRPDIAKVSLIHLIVNGIVYWTYKSRLLLPSFLFCKYNYALFQLPPLTGYKAIPALTLEYLEAVEEIFRKGGSDHLNTPTTDKCLEDTEFKFEWHICTSWVHI